MLNLIPLRCRPQTKVWFALYLMPAPAFSASQMFWEGLGVSTGQAVTGAYQLAGLCSAPHTHTVLELWALRYSTEPSYLRRTLLSLRCCNYVMVNWQVYFDLIASDYFSPG